MRRAALLVLAVFPSLGGCHLVFPFNPGGGGRVDAVPDGLADQASDTIPFVPCVETADQETLLLYTFSGSGSTIDDVTGNHPGTIVGAGVARVDGKAGCGPALSFSGSTPPAYVEVPDADEWDLTSGSVDFWVRFDNPPGTSEGIVSRDANLAALPGHFTMMRLCDGTLLARLQRDDTTQAVRCWGPTAQDTWYAVGVNFGAEGLELWVNGEPADSTETVVCDNQTSWCGQDADGGIDGNDNPWVIGAASWVSDEGLATPVTSPFSGQIDSFRISRIRRSYQGFR